MTKRQIFNGWQKITNTQKTEDWDAQTTKNPDWHVLRCSIRVCSSNFTNSIHVRKSWGQLPSLLLKIEGGGNSFAPLFGIKFKKKKLFYFSMEAYIVHLAKGIRIFGQGYALKPKWLFFFLLLQFWKYTNFIKMYTECNEHHLVYLLR